MLIEPASNVSVPLTVVIRTLSNAPAKLGETPPNDVVNINVAVLAKIPDATHVLLDIRVKTTFPETVKVAPPEPKEATNPAVDEAAVVVVEIEAEDTYPEFVTEPEPIWIKGDDVPLILTPLNITVIRLAVDGIPVKSMLVPDVDATAVLDLMTPETLPDASIDIAVIPEPDPVTIFNVPLVSVDIAVPPLVELPAVIIFAMFYP